MCVGAANGEDLESVVGVTWVMDKHNVLYHCVTRGGKTYLRSALVTFAHLVLSLSQTNTFCLKLV